MKTTKGDFNIRPILLQSFSFIVFHFNPSPNVHVDKSSFPFLLSPFLKQVPLFTLVIIHLETWPSCRWICESLKLKCLQNILSSPQVNTTNTVWSSSMPPVVKVNHLPFLSFFLSFTLSLWAWRAPWFTRFARMGAYLSVKGGLFLWVTIEKYISEEMEVKAARLENTR